MSDSEDKKDTLVSVSVVHSTKCVDPETCPANGFKELAEQLVQKAGEAGPAKYNSKAYRAGWDAIDWGNKEVGQLSFCA